MARPKGDNKESKENKEIRLIKDAKETGEAGESGENKKTGETGETMKRDHIEGRENMSEIKNIKEIKELKEKEGKESGKEISREPLNPEKVKALDLAMKQIKKDFGDGSIMKLGESQSMAVEVISTGSLNLNMALGVGGVPRGRIIEVYGQESSGKTTIALHILAEAQKAGGIGAFIDAEHALDPEYAKNLGVDVDELLISQPDYGEQALEIADMLVRSGAVDVIVVDSVAALVPKVEIDGEMSDQQMGLQARLMSKALRKLTGTLNKSKTTMIFINQIREKIGGFGFGPQTTTTGGKALKFYSSVRMEVKRIGSVKQGDDVIGNETIVKVTKNKVAPPFKEAAFQIMYGRGITRTGEIFELALENNVIAKAGAWFSFGDMRLGQGKENVKAKLEEDKALFAQIESAVLAIMAEHKLKSSKKGSPSVSGEDAGAELREEIA